MARERLRPRLARALPFIEEIKSQFGNGKEYRIRHDLVVKEDEAKASSKPQLQQMLVGDLNGQREQYRARMKWLRDPAKAITGRAH